MCRAGKPLSAKPTDAEILRFMSRVAIGPDSGDCWLWTGCLDPWGYGGMKWRGVRLFVHRFAYAILAGELAAGMQVHHTCHHPPCVNPAHLTLVSHADNAAIKSKASIRRDGAFWRQYIRETVARWKAEV